MILFLRSLSRCQCGNPNHPSLPLLILSHFRLSGFPFAKAYSVEKEQKGSPLN